MLAIKDRVFEPYIFHNKDNHSLDKMTMKTIFNLTKQHKLVLLRGFDPLDRAALLHWAQSQAELLHWNTGPVMEMKVDSATKNYLFTEGDVPLHWDGAFHREPRLLFFHCLQAPEPWSGGETIFISTESVWEDQTEQVQDRWLGYEISCVTEKLAHYGGEVRCPLVQTHPDTGKPILRFAEPVGEHYLNPVQVTIHGKSSIHSQRIIAEISKKMRQESHCYVHQWQEGDYLIADNFALLHGRNAFHHSSPRHLRRIQIL